MLEGKVERAEMLAFAERSFRRGMNRHTAFLRYAVSHRAFAFGLCVVFISLVLAVIGPLITPYDPEAATTAVLQAPSGSHWFGTDAVGTDVFSRVIAAFRVDVLIAVVAIGLSLVGGIFLGAMTGFAFSGRAGRVVSWIVLRSMDMIQALPVFVLALALVGTTGPSVQNVVISVAFVNLPVFMRLTRGAVLVTAREAYVDASRVIGLPERRILTRHILPNSLDPVFANASIAVGFGILLTAGLSFLGAGVRPPSPEWGLAIATGSANLITGEWWVSVLPGFVLTAVVLGFALVGDGIRRYRDPAGRQAGLELRSVGR